MALTITRLVTVCRFNLLILRVLFFSSIVYWELSIGRRRAEDARECDRKCCFLLYDCDQMHTL